MKVDISKLTSLTNKFTDLDIKRYQNELNNFINKSNETDFNYLLKTSMVLCDDLGSDLLLTTLGLDRGNEVDKEFIEIIEALEKNHKDAEVLRSMSSENSRTIITYVLERLIISYNDLDTEKYDDDTIGLIHGVLGWSIDSIIGKRFVYEKFDNNLFVNFGFNKEISKFIYDLIIKNKEELFKYLLMKRLERLENIISND